VKTDEIADCTQSSLEINKANSNGYGGRPASGMLFLLLKHILSKPITPNGFGSTVDLTQGLWQAHVPLY